MAAKVKVGSLRRRFLALIIDYIVIIGYMGVLILTFLTVYQLRGGGIPNWIELYGAAGAQMMGFAVLTLPVVAYFIISERCCYGATLGKRVESLQVAPIGAKDLSWSRVIVRNAVKFLPWELAHTAVYQLMAALQRGTEPSMRVMSLLLAANVLPILYLVVISMRRDRRGPHDMIAGTMVVRRER